MSSCGDAPRHQGPWRVARAVWFLVGTLLIVLALAPSRGVAAGHDAAKSAADPQGSEARARQLLTTGAQALQTGNRLAAQEALTESYRLARNPEVLFHLGMLALAENRMLPARDLLLRYLAELGPEVSADSPLRKEAERVLKQPAPPAAELAIFGERGTLLYVDGRLSGGLPLPRPLVLSPEEHQVALLREKRRLQGPVRVPVGRLGELRFDHTTGAMLFAVQPGIVLIDRYESAPAEALRELSTALLRAVQRERLSPLASAPQPGTAPTQEGCQPHPACLIEIGNKSGAEYVLDLRAQRANTGWQLRVLLTSIEVGAVAAQRDDSCPDCSVTQLAQKLEDSFAALWGEAQSRPRGTLEVRSSITGAAVWLDGIQVGQTPYSHAAWAGRRQLEVRAPGYAVEHRELELADGKTQTIEVQLKPQTSLLMAAPPAQRGRRPHWRVYTGIVALGVGVVLLGFGASALSVNGACTDTPAVAGAECVYLYRSLPVGAALTSVGGALLIGGAGLLAAPGPRMPPVPPSGSSD